MFFIALWFLSNSCGIFSSSSCDSCINVFIMDWAACWCTFCASLRTDCRIICLCLFLHVTMNLVTHCAPLLAATRHGASLVQPQVTFNCVHSSVGDEAYNCTTSPPPCWFPGATLPSHGPPPSTTSPPSCWFPRATLPSYRHPPSTTSPPPCSSPGVTLLSYGPPPLSAATPPPPFCFPVPPNTLATTRQASVNSDSLVTLTVPHKATSHPTGNSRPAQNSLRLAYFNAQSCRQKASEINDLVVDGDFDILLMTETWLYASCDEAYITEMTPSGYLFHSFPRIGRRGGGKSALSDSISMHPLPFNSFESVELRLLNDSTSVSVISLYRPPPSKQNKLSNKMFFEEFPTLFLNTVTHAEISPLLVILTFISDFQWRC